MIENRVEILIDGKETFATEGELLVEAILREKEIRHLCYHSPLMGPKSYRFPRISRIRFGESSSRPGPVIFAWCS